MAKPCSTTEFEDVECYVNVEYECGYFNVTYQDPLVEDREGVNLIVTRYPENYQERNFEDRLLGEIDLRKENKASIYSARPLAFTHLRKGILYYEDIALGEDFGPFHRYTYVRLYQ